MDVKEKALREISRIQSTINGQGYSSSGVTEKNYNYELAAEINKSSFKVQVYFGKKGVKTVIQGNSDSEEYRLLQNLIFDQSSLDFVQPEIKIPNEYIGSDECGKGDFFGPLVTGAVYVNSETQIKLTKLGVRDSKDLSEYQIHDLAKHIRQIGSENYEVIKINPAKYNQLYDQFKNLNKLLNWAHSKAIDNLLQRTKCKTVITDKFSNKDLVVTNNVNHSSVQFIQEHKAEKYVGVAAASILARDEFNSWFINQKKAGYNLPKGASDAVVDAASKLLAQRNQVNLGDFVKLHFKLLDKVKRKL